MYSHSPLPPALVAGIRDSFLPLAIRPDHIKAFHPSLSPSVTISVRNVVFFFGGRVSRFLASLFLYSL